ncbi:AvaI/BsoBI family type II restriction endonuclease [Candidatus Endomicrobiellum trichonymphae]
MNIKTPEDLVTSREQTRAGFISFALEKKPSIYACYRKR